ncbi:MAG: hypothetical protein OXF79_23895 [Chloroflexi bacterium]|nr:hypothetical protein [Chloroflexota bacterium]
MKFLPIILALAFLSSSTAVAAPLGTHHDGLTEPTADSIVGDGALTEVTGRGSQDSCIGSYIGFGLGLLAFGAATGFAPAAVVGAFLPAVGAIACSL